MNEQQTVEETETIEETARRTVLKVATHHFGTIEVGFDQFVYFPEGIIGLEELKRYALLAPYGEESLFRWLQSMDRSDISFLVVDPAVFSPGYGVTLTEQAREKMVLKEGDTPRLLAITLIPKEEKDQLWINLQAPIVWNGAQKIAYQCVLDGEKFPIRHKVFVKSFSKEQTPKAA